MCDTSALPGGPVGLFFYVQGEFLFHSCRLAQAERFGGFLCYPAAHLDIWEQQYAARYGNVDF